MELRYYIPFADNLGNKYRVEIYREDYAGEAKELTGAASCFVVSGTDEDFIYTPIRTSTATISVLDSDLLLDLYSINNQYAPVKLYKNEVLEWTGYIKPEQFTQNYIPTVGRVSVECVCALATLENVVYKGNTNPETVTLWKLLKDLIGKANGGYKGVFIPKVYGENETMAGNVFESIRLIENNFLSEEKNCLEILEAVCKFLNWTLFDIGGNLYFVDSDWKGTYLKYDEALSLYSEVEGNDLQLQTLGFINSDSNTLDIVPGYNKASVKAINNVFDNVVKDEDFDKLKPYADGLYYAGTYKKGNEARAVRKQFVKPENWKLFAYDSNGVGIGEPIIENYGTMELNVLRGALLVREADYTCKSIDNDYPTEDVAEFNYEKVVQIRTATELVDAESKVTNQQVVIMEGEYAVYSDCAISINGTITPYFDSAMNNDEQKITLSKALQVKIELGGKYFNGETWQDEETRCDISVNENGDIKNTGNPFQPYKGLSGFVIPIDFITGKPRITIYAPAYRAIIGWGMGYSTGVKIKNLAISYAKKEGIVEEGEDGDRVYSNTVNEDYMSEAEEISFEISSYNADGATYSKALLGESWLTNNLFCAVVGEMVRPEELMIKRIVNRYEVTKIKLTEGLRTSDLVTPLSILTERTQPGRTFRMTSGEWDYEQGRMTIQIQENAQ